MRIPTGLCASIEEFTTHLDRLTGQGVPRSTFYFANGADWLVRVVPEARQHGLPLWLSEGTTFGQAEADTINRLLGMGEQIQVVVAHDAWNGWRGGMDWPLSARFEHRRVGPNFHLYSLRTDLDRQQPISLAAMRALGVKRAVSMMLPASAPAGSMVPVAIFAATDAGGGEKVGFLHADYSIDGGATWNAIAYEDGLEPVVARMSNFAAGPAGSKVLARLRVAFRGGESGDVDSDGGPIDWEGSWGRWESPSARTAQTEIVAR